LQKLRDSSYLKYVVERLSNLERKASNLINGLPQHILLENPLIVSYDRLGYLPASLVFWFNTILNPYRRVLLSDFNSVIYHIAPYREGDSIIAFASNPYTPSVYEFLQTTNLLGLEAHVFLPSPQDTKVREALNRFRGVHYVEVWDEVEASLAETLGVFGFYSNAFKDKLGRRGMNLQKHAEEGFSVIAEELARKYSDVLEKILAERELFVSSTKILEPAGQLFSQALRNIGVRSIYTHLDQIPGSSTVLLLTSSVEEFLVKPRVVELTHQGSRVHGLQLNTDPLESLVYIGILAFFLSKLKSF
jgi:hypothetical protein